MTPPGLSPHHAAMAWALLALGVTLLFVMILLLARTVTKAANRKRTWVFSHLRETESDEAKRERYRC